jgi:hypothetical protein
MEALFEQIIVAGAVFGYYFLTKTSPPSRPSGRGRSCSNSSESSFDDSACEDHRSAHPTKLHAVRALTIWAAVASGVACYRVLAGLHYTHCTGSAFKSIMALITPGQCAMYELYMNYIKSLGGLVIFAITAQVWQFLGVDTESVLEAHQSISRLNTREC